MVGGQYVVSPAPNPRLQRTRATRSPLSRQPLGGLSQLVLPLSIVFTLAATVACETFNGKLYWAGSSPGFLAKSACEAADRGLKGMIVVKVTTENGTVIPGVTVRFARSKPDVVVEYLTDSKGVATASLDAGVWLLNTSLDGLRPARFSLDLIPDQTCTIELKLRIDRGKVVVVVA